MGLIMAYDENIVIVILSFWHAMAMFHKPDNIGNLVCNTVIMTALLLVLVEDKTMVAALSLTLVAFTSFGFMVRKTINK